MASSAQELKDWLNTLDPDVDVAIDEDGLTLIQVGHPGVYFELGGCDPTNDPIDEVPDFAVAQSSV